MRRAPLRNWPVIDSGAGHDLVGGSLRHDPPAVPARPGSHVDDVIGAADRLFVVLDHDQGVAQVAQVQEGVEKTPIVALVQAD